MNRTTNTGSSQGSSVPGHRVLESRYGLLEAMGSGDVATVYRAWDHQLQHILAIKLLDRRWMERPGVAEAFEREGRRVASLPAHRNIVTIYHVGHDGGLPYLVMEFVKSTTLKDVIDREGPLPVERAFDIARQIATGLEFAHQYGLLHRNLQPRNILVSPLGQVKLTGFGGVYPGVTAAAGPDCPLTLRAQYLSPEQAGGGDATTSSDLYALGLILYEMLTGVPLFSGDDPGAVARKQIEERPVDPRTRNGSLPPEVAALVLRALEKDPEKRYRSASAFASAVQEYVFRRTGATVPLHVPETAPERRGAQPVSPSSRLQQEERKRKALHAVHRPRRRARVRRIPLGSLIFLAVVGVAFGGGWYTYQIVERLMNGASTPGATHTRPPVRRHVVHRKTAVTAHPTGKAQAVLACLNGPAPVRLAHFWVERVEVPPGTPVTFDYTVSNGSSQCHNVVLGLQAFNSAQPALVLASQPASPVGAAPGVHVYKRRFTFPPSSAGQTYDVALSVAPVGRPQTANVARVNHLIHVLP